MILKNYINKDIYRVTAAILLVLILIFVSSRFVKYIQLAVDGTISAKAVFILLSLQIPSIAGFLIPLAFFLAILMTFGQLYSDNELVVVHGLGLGQRDLAKMLLPMAFIFAVIAGSLSTMLTPWAISQSKLLMAEQAAQAKLGIFSAGRFRENSNRDGIVFVESKSDDGVIVGVFSASRPVIDAVVDEEQGVVDKDKKSTLIKIQTAKIGRQWENSETGVNYLVLDEGQFLEELREIEEQEGTEEKITKDRWQMTDFASSYTKIAQDELAPVKQQIKSSSMFDLFYDIDNEKWAEIHWRLAAPISIPLICLLAVPLSRTQPRQGKFGRILPSIMIYLIYILLMMYSRKLIESGRIPGVIGFWWIHLGMAIFVNWLYRPLKFKRNYDKGGESSDDDNKGGKPSTEVSNHV